MYKIIGKCACGGDVVVAKERRTKPKCLGCYLEGSRIKFEINENNRKARRDK